MVEATQNSVETALGEILDAEQDRVRSEEEDRRLQEEARRRRWEEERLRRMEEQACVVAEEARRRLEEERREQEQLERREHERHLAEIRVRQELEGKTRLAEEELRLKYERDIAVLEAARRRTPTWVWVTIAGLVLLAGAAGTLPYLAYQDADAALAAERAARREDRAASEQRLQGLRRSQAKSDAERQQLLTDVRDGQRRIDELQARLDRAEPGLLRIAALEAENDTLRADVAALRAVLEGRPGRPALRPPRPTDTTQPATHRECVNVGQPLEECFDCPGDSRCR